MPDYLFTVSLKVTHPSFNYQSISQALSLEPSIAHNIGDPRYTRKGHALGGYHKETLWSLDLCNGKKLDAEKILFEEFIEQWNTNLAKHKAFISEIRSSGGVVEYFVGWFSVDSINMSIALDPSLLKSTAELGLSIVLHAYLDEE